MKARYKLALLRVLVRAIIGKDRAEALWRMAYRDASEGFWCEVCEAEIGKRLAHKEDCPLFGWNVRYGCYER